MFGSSQDKCVQLHHFTVLLSLNFISSNQAVMCPPSFQTVHN